MLLRCVIIPSYYCTGTGGLENGKHHLVDHYDSGKRSFHRNRDLRYPVQKAYVVLVGKYGERI